MPQAVELAFVLVLVPESLDFVLPMRRRNAAAALAAAASVASLEAPLSLHVVHRVTSEARPWKPSVATSGASWAESKKCASALETPPSPGDPHDDISGVGGFLASAFAMGTCTFSAVGAAGGAVGAAARAPPPPQAARGGPGVATTRREGGSSLWAAVVAAVVLCAPPAACAAPPRDQMKGRLPFAECHVGLPGLRCNSGSSSV
mmetsp:Transcript_116394/g.336213  ORF Transcript_116394/g.336213 Transcript_116394/m.336213 type:complete len:204 (+) Transcript_116394:483-1094(+)